MNAYAINKEFNGIEITFQDKPSEAIRTQLKENGFRWHKLKKVWYAKNTAERLEFAKHLCNDKKAKESATGTKQDHIKIYWNGIKIDGEKLIRCHYSLDNNAEKTESVCIYASDYDDLPRDLLPVKNDSDLYTDYFEKDRANITPEHPLYKYFRYAAEKARARDAKRHIEWLEKLLSAPQRFDGQHEMYKNDIATNQKYISNFESMTDPGQPTAEDLEKINRQRQEEENEKRAAEHAEELRERENFLIKKCNGKNLLDKETKAHPIKENEPFVIIQWSEHPAFYEYEDGELKLSVCAAENILKTLDEEQHNTRETAIGSGWYDKTKFTVVYKDKNGETCEYTGRYDLGDNDGGLVRHIGAFNKELSNFLSSFVA